MYKICKITGLSLCLTLLSQYSAMADAKQQEQANVLPVYSLQQTIKLSLANHPELKPFVYQQRANELLTQQAQVATPFTIDASVTDAMGTNNYSGVSAMQSELSLSWLLEDKQLKAKGNLAKTQAEQTQIELQLKAIDLAAETAEMFIILLSQQEQLKLAKQAERQAESMLKDINKKVKVGKTAIIDQLRGKADVAKKQLEVEDLIHEIEATKSQLSAQWQGNDQFEVSGSLASLPNQQQLDLLLTQVNENPMLQLYASKQRLASSKAELAKVENKPAWKVSAGVKHNNELDDFALSAGISIPFSLEDRNTYEIKALNEQEHQLQAQAEAWQSRVATELLLLVHKLKHNLHVVEGLRDTIIPDLEQASTLAEKAFKQGSYSYSDWYIIQQELNTAQLELIQAFSNIQIFNIEVERLTGRSASQEWIQ